MTKPIDPFCGKMPEQLSEYTNMVKDSPQTASEYVVSEEGTYSPRYHMFTCTDCYIKLDMPLNRHLEIIYKERSEEHGKEKGIP